MGLTQSHDPKQWVEVSFSVDGSAVAADGEKWASRPIPVRWNDGTTAFVAFASGWPRARTYATNFVHRTLTNDIAQNIRSATEVGACLSRSIERARVVGIGTCAFEDDLPTLQLVQVDPVSSEEEIAHGRACQLVLLLWPDDEVLQEIRRPEIVVLTSLTVCAAKAADQFVTAAPDSGPQAHNTHPKEAHEGRLGADAVPRSVGGEHAPLPLAMDTWPQRAYQLGWTTSPTISTASVGTPSPGSSVATADDRHSIGRMPPHDARLSREAPRGGSRGADAASSAGAASVLTAGTGIAASRQRVPIKGPVGGTYGQEGAADHLDPKRAERALDAMGPESPFGSAVGAAMGASARGRRPMSGSEARLNPRLRAGLLPVPPSPFEAAGRAFTEPWWDAARNLPHLESFLPWNRELLVHCDVVECNHGGVQTATVVGLHNKIRWIAAEAVPTFVTTATNFVDFRAASKHSVEARRFKRSPARETTICGSCSFRVVGAGVVRSGSSGALLRRVEPIGNGADLNDAVFWGKVLLATDVKWLSKEAQRALISVRGTVVPGAAGSGSGQSQEPQPRQEHETGDVTEPSSAPAAARAAAPSREGLRRRGPLSRGHLDNRASSSVSGPHVSSADAGPVATLRELMTSCNRVDATNATLALGALVAHGATAWRSHSCASSD